MSDKPYYHAYEERYQKVYEAGAELWGYSPDDEMLFETLEGWVLENGLNGKKVLEFACGEGSCGIILSKLGCNYHGVDIAPSAINKATQVLKGYPTATVSLHDMVNEPIVESYDAALDVMGFHMLVTDLDRVKYLKNAYQSLKANSPMLFFHESYRTDAPEIFVESFEQWKTISGDDYETPEQRFAGDGNHQVEVWIPLVPARAKNRNGYVDEMQNAGFIVDNFIETRINDEPPHSASIFVHKP